MDEKDYRIKRLQEDVKENSKKITELEGFKYTTIERLKTLFERINDIEKSNKWVSQSFFYLILSGVIGAIFSLIGWLITR